MPVGADSEAVAPGTLATRPAAKSRNAASIRVDRVARSHQIEGMTLSDSAAIESSAVRLLSREEAEREDRLSGIPRRRPSGSPPLSSCARSLMATMLLPPEFKRLLSALSLRKVEYLVVGGYAVIFHCYVRTTGDLVTSCHRSFSTSSKAARARG